MNWMGDRIAFEAKMGDGSAADAGIMGKLLSVGKRALTGESLFMTHFRNEGRDKQRVAGRNGRRADLPERRLSLRRPRHRALHRFQPEMYRTYKGYFLRMKGILFVFPRNMKPLPDAVRQPWGRAG